MKFISRGLPDRCVKDDNNDGNVEYLVVTALGRKMTKSREMITMIMMMMMITTLSLQHLGEGLS